MTATKFATGDKVRISVDAKHKHWIAMQEVSIEHPAAGWIGTVRRAHEPDAEIVVEVEVDGLVYDFSEAELSKI